MSVAGAAHDGPAVPPRLPTELDRLVRARITVICAPAGFGKFDLVREWLQGRDDDLPEDDSQGDAAGGRLPGPAARRGGRPATASAPRPC